MFLTFLPRERFYILICLILVTILLLLINIVTDSAIMLGIISFATEHCSDSDWYLENMTYYVFSITWLIFALSKHLFLKHLRVKQQANNNYLFIYFPDSLSNTTKTKKRCLNTFPNTEKRVENKTHGGGFLADFEVFG